MKPKLPLLILKILARLVMSATAVGIFILAVEMINAKPDEVPRVAKVFFATFLLITGIVLIPFWGWMLNLLKRKAGPGFQKIVLYTRIGINLIRGFIAFILLLSLVLTFNEWKGQISTLFAQKVKLPVIVTEKKMRDWEQMIEQGKARTVFREVKEIKNYREKVDNLRLSAKYLVVNHNKAQKLVNESGNSATAYFRLREALSQGGMCDTLWNIKAGRYYQSPLAVYISEDNMRTILDDVIRLGINEKSNPEIRTAVTVMSRLDPANPSLLLYKAERRWRNKRWCGMREAYHEYEESTRKRGLSTPIPERVKEILDAPTHWGPAAANLTAKWWLLTSKKYDFTSWTSISNRLSLGDITTGRFEHDLLKFTEMSNLLKFFIPDCGQMGLSTWGVWEKISGHSVSMGSTEDSPFAHINPQIIRWGIDNLIPSPEYTVRGVTYRKIYENCFRDITRLYALCYVYLTNVKDISAEAHAYKSAFSDEEFHAIPWLSDRYDDFRSDIDERVSYRSDQIFGFWLRRYLDGSADVIWEAFSYLLSLYDNQFLQNITSPDYQFSDSLHTEAVEEEVW